MSESLPFTWAKTDQDIGTEAQYAKISDDLNDIAIKWGAEIQGEPDKRVFQSKRFGGMGLEVSIYTKKSLDNQTVFIHRGTNTGGFQPLKRGGDNDTMIPLKARVAQEQTPGGISYPVQKQQGLLVVDKEFSIEKEKYEEFNYNILKWVEDKYKKDLKDYYSEKPIKYLFYIPNDQMNAINNNINQFKNKNKNLTLRKMSEYMKISDLFYKAKEIKN